MNEKRAFPDGAECKPNVSRQLIDYAMYVADRCESTADSVNNRLSAVMRHDPGKTPSCEEVNEDWPELFATLRHALQRIEESTRHIDNTLDRTEL